jgi:hypothetical protein
MDPNPINKGEPVFLVEGPPKWGDAKFLGEWLSAAWQANQLWELIFKDPCFKIYVDRLTVCYVPDFGVVAAAFLLMHLKERSGYFVIPLNSEEAELFALMAAMGFFKSEGAIHQMAIPSKLTIAKVKGAVGELAKTEDRDFVLHPENLVATMPLSEAESCRQRQIAMREFQQDAANESIGSYSVVH